MAAHLRVNPEDQIDAGTIIWIVFLVTISAVRLTHGK